MIEEIGRVVALEGPKAWVETQIKTTCTSCKASDSCPTSTIAKAFNPHKEHILIEPTQPLKVGQYVKIGIHESALLQASILIYLFPLFALILSAVGIKWLMPALHELGILFIASGFAFIALWFASRYSKKHKHLYAPIFLGAVNSQVTLLKGEIPMQKLH